MVIIIALVLSVILQLGAAFFALSLIKRTKYNASWILISISFSFMAFQRMYDLVLITNNDIRLEHESILSSWLSVVISLLIFIGTFFIKKIFNLQDRIESIRKGNEQRIFSAIIRTEEGERQRFAKEIHDGLGPILSSIKMAISALSLSPDSKTDKEIIKKTTFAIDEAIITIKEVSNKLSPHILRNYGIERAVQNFIDTILLHKNLWVNFNSQLNGLRLDYNIETVVYRVICEFIANTLQHAQASNISIAISVKNNTLHIKYSDDGIGFNMTQLPDSGMGLSNIQSRVTSLNGECEMQSESGNGFFANITIPLLYESDET